MAANLREASGWYRRAAQLGDAEAQYTLALMLDTGTGIGLNPRRARYWYRRAAARRLPVTDDKGHLVGVLALDDVMELLVEEAEAIGRLLKRRAPLDACTTRQSPRTPSPTGARCGRSALSPRV